jgi:hypothetical protein
VNASDKVHYNIKERAFGAPALFYFPVKYIHYQILQGGSIYEYKNHLRIRQGIHKKTARRPPVDRAGGMRSIAAQYLHRQTSGQGF